jgi:signal transduction histidine kinase
VRTVRETGLDIELAATGDFTAVPSAVAVSAYRIVQEALTNVVRHAGPCRVWLRICRQDGALEISVDDDGRTPDLPLPEGGHGLAGMRERAVALGGAFEAAPREDGGFRVAATLPITRSTT